MAAIVDETSGAPAFLVWIIRAEDALHGMADAFPLGRLGVFFIAAFIVQMIYSGPGLFRWLFRGKSKPFDDDLHMDSAMAFMVVCLLYGLFMLAYVFARWWVH